MAKKSKPVEPSAIEPRRLVRYIAWLMGATTWLMLALSMLSYDHADWPSKAVFPHNEQPHNWIGWVGALMAYQIYLTLGPGAWILMAAGLVLIIATARNKPITQPVLRLIGVVIMSLTLSAIVGLSLPIITHRFEGSGGLVAIFVNDQLQERFAWLGTMIVLVVFFWVGALLTMDELVMAIPRLSMKAWAMMPKISVPKPVLVGFFSSMPRPGRRPGDDMQGPGRKNEAPSRSKRESSAAVLDPDDGGIDEDAGGLGATESFDPDAGSSRRRNRAAEEDLGDEAKPGRPAMAETRAAERPTPITREDGAPIEDEPEVPAELDDETDGADAPGAYIAEKRQFDPDALRARIKQLPINFAPRAPGSGSATGKGSGASGGGMPGASAAPDLTGYVFPGIDLLVEPESNFTEEMGRMVKEQAEQLEMALQQYRIDGSVIGIDSGPVITLYEVRLAPGTKVAALGAIASDLARALKAHNIRIVPNMAGKDTVGIEVPNLVKEKVRLKELMTAHAEIVSKMQIPMFLGKDASGNPLIADLATMPHMLIAGTTGSGKSVCMNSIIMSFMFTKRPDELKAVLVDPKMVEMSQFKDIPHLMCPVVTEMSKAAAILEWATTKMDERYELLAEAGVRDVGSYNGLGWEELKERFQPANEAEEARIPKKLPYLVFIIDELADLMMTNKEVEGFIVRLAQKSRAVGMHLILATQRPQANVVTGLIKSNMPCRVSFKVASGMDSRIVLDQKGAELLLGQGDMLFLSPRTSKLTRAQGTLVDDLEIRKSVKFLKEIAQQNFEPQLIQLRAPDAEGEGGEEAMERDPLFDDAVRVVLQTKRGSVSLLQRRLTIGYSRASRLIEQMAAAGLLGDYKGSQAREVTISLEEWEAMKAQAEADAAGGDGGPAAGHDGGEEDDGGVPDEMDDEYKQ